MKDENFFRTSKGRLKDVLFYWDERTNFERTKDVHFRSRADWTCTVIVQCFLFFCQIFVNVSLLKGELLLVGDFNYPNINWEKLYFSHTPEHCASKFFTATQNSFLHQHVSTTAHSRTNQRSTLIDLIFTSDDQLITNLICGSRLGKGHHKFLEFNY